MYNTIEEYVRASELTKLKVGDTVFLQRGPVLEDGIAIPFSTTRFWIDYYVDISYHLYYEYTISDISTKGLFFLDKMRINNLDCPYIIPFFFLKGYDHNIQTLQQISKSKYLQFDKRAKQITKGLMI